ncbi:hypothetical protein PENANT_c021G06925 [Penicillium antarcticum]|uniref:phosphopyruvate hydratase n=1 Tax=Penicillium antarcticum TaxID=416450 RepID=A0A1V6Q009_9EURO|nr:hypothetical protein PENANT_c021G06925 [Penicillium antarcticum]
MGSQVYQKLKKVIVEQFGLPAVGIGDEGGFAPPISQPHEALDLLIQAVSLAGYDGKMQFAIDPTSSEFYRDRGYDVGFKDDKPNMQSPREMIHLYCLLLQNYPIFLFEDPLAESDWGSWTEFNTERPIELVGDDLLVKNTQCVQEAYDRIACNSMVLKIYQIATIYEAIEAWVSPFVINRAGNLGANYSLGKLGLQF